MFLYIFFPFSLLLSCFIAFNLKGVLGSCNPRENNLCLRQMIQSAQKLLDPPGKTISHKKDRSHAGSFFLI